MSDATGAKLISERSNRYLALDGLRGVAALMIVFVHMPWNDWMLSSFTGGFIDKRVTGCLAIGVDRFFVLSGFLITSILMKSIGDKKYYYNFYGRRVLRIFPLYYSAIAGFAMICYFLPQLLPSYKVERFYLTWPWLVLYLGNVYQMIILGANMTFVHFWSLAIEEHFYMVWPFLVKQFSRVLPRVIIFAIILCVFTRLVIWVYFRQQSEIWNHVFTISRADSLVLGGLLAYLYIRNHSIIGVGYRFWYLSYILIFVMAFIQSKIYGPGTFFYDVFGYTLYAVGFSGVILHLLKNDKSVLSIFLSWKPIVYVGSISYSLYVFHFPINSQLANYESRCQGSVPKTIGLTLIALIISLLVSSLSYHFYESIFLRMKDKWFSK